MSPNRVIDFCILHFCIDFAACSGCGLLLASASQDKMVRLWAIQPSGSQADISPAANGHNLESSLAKSIAR